MHVTRDVFEVAHGVVGQRGDRLGLGRPADGGPLGPLGAHGGGREAQQCGFCTPGFLAATVELLDRNAKPSEAEIRAALAGNTCRCTGYQHIIDAVVRASEAAS